jgi:hypothetical protein
MITESKQLLYISQTFDDRNLINPIITIQIRERLLLRDYSTLKKKEKSHFRPPVQSVNESKKNDGTLMMTLGDNK